MKKLKEVVDKQRDEIRAKDRELGLKNEDVEAVSGYSFLPTLENTVDVQKSFKWLQSLWTMPD